MTVPLPTIDRYTLLGEWGYTQKTLAERQAAFFRDLTVLNSVGELVTRSLDQAMAREVLGISSSGGGLVQIPGDLQTTGTPSAVTALFGDGSWKNLATSQVLTKASVGLDQVDNTSDLNKPISTATQNALNAITAGSISINSPAFTGNPTAPTPALLDNDTSLATTAFVNTYQGQMANAIPGSRFDYRCVGGVQPLRNTITTRRDIYIDWLMTAQPKDEVAFPGYAILGDGWRKESW